MRQSYTIRKFSFRLYLSLVVMSLALCLSSSGGCKSRETHRPPTQIQSQPIDATSAALLVEDAAQDIVTRLPAEPGIADARYRLVLGLGPVEITSFSRPRRFDTVMRSLNTRLMANATMTRHFRMVAVSTPSTQEVLVRLSGGHHDTFEAPDSDVDSGQATYDPRDIYILTGQFSQFGDRGNQDRSLQLTIQVEHPHSRTIVLSQHFQRNFRWDSASGTWIPVP